MDIFVYSCHALAVIFFPEVFEVNDFRTVVFNMFTTLETFQVLNCLHTATF